RHSSQMKRLCVYLIRHAESENNARGDHDVSGSDTPGDAGCDDGVSSPAAKRAKTRQADPGLTEQGHAQARAVGQLLRRLQTDEKTRPEQRPRLLFASGFKRALQTCRHVSEATG
ncbi:unnamed protein product, partial [Prorocentrum cordatum]